MFASVLLTALLTIFSANSTPAPAAPPADPVRITMGSVSFSGNALNFRKQDDKSYEWVIQGNAELTFGSGQDIDITVNSQTMEITGNADSEITIICYGDCHWKDAEYQCRSDRMGIWITGTEMKVKLVNNCSIEYGTGDNRTILTGNVITNQPGSPGTFNISGAGSLKRGQ